MTRFAVVPVASVAADSVAPEVSVAVVVSVAEVSAVVPVAEVSAVVPVSEVSADPVVAVPSFEEFWADDGLLSFPTERVCTMAVRWEQASRLY